MQAWGATHHGLHPEIGGSLTRRRRPPHYHDLHVDASTGLGQGVVMTAGGGDEAGDDHL